MVLGSHKSNLTIFKFRFMVSACKISNIDNLCRDFEQENQSWVRRP